jgi:hypothetical protein
MLETEMANKPRARVGQKTSRWKLFQIGAGAGEGSVGKRRREQAADRLTLNLGDRVLIDEFEVQILPPNG